MNNKNNQTRNGAVVSKINNMSATKRKLIHTSNKIIGTLDRLTGCSLYPSVKEAKSLTIVNQNMPDPKVLTSNLVISKEEFDRLRQ